MTRAPKRRIYVEAKGWDADPMWRVLSRAGIAIERAELVARPPSRISGGPPWPLPEGGPARAILLVGAANDTGAKKQVRQMLKSAGVTIGKVVPATGPLPITQGWSGDGPPPPAAPNQVRPCNCGSGEPWTRCRAKLSCGAPL